MLGIVINPKSGKKAFRRQRLYLFNLLRSRHQHFSYKVTKYAGHATELARELVERGCNQILVLGGDGTLSETINGIMTARIPEEQRKQIHFGLMPRGTGNDYGRFWKLDKDFRRSLHLFFNESKSQPVDIGEITFYRNGEEQKRYFMNAVGFGIDALTCSITAELKYYLGSHSLNYTLALLLAFFKFKSTPMEVIADGNSLGKHKVFTMNVGNGPYIGGGIIVNSKADPRDGIFQTTFVEKPTLKDVFNGLSHLFNGEFDKLDFVKQFESQEVEVLTNNKHVMVEIDGILENFIGNCKIRNLHHAICMTVPNYC